MSKRAVAAILWFSAAWFGYEIVWSLTGAPRLAGPIIAFLLGAVVTVDPFGWFWSKSADEATTTPAREPSQIPA